MTNQPRGFTIERDHGRKRVGQFLRTVAKLFLLVFTVAAVISPPEPIVFALLLVPGWIVAFPLAYYLVYRDGYAAVRASDVYRPGPLVGQTTTWFAATVFGLKIALTLFYEFVIPLPLTRAEGLFISLVALAVGYAFVYQGGWGLLLDESTDT